MLYPYGNSGRQRVKQQGKAAAGSSGGRATVKLLAQLQKFGIKA